MLNFVRHEFPTQDIHGDFEGALTLNHMEILYRLDDFNLCMVEQPLPADDLVGHAMVQEALRTPVCLDESITTPAQADMALELHSAKYLNINPIRVGGLTPAKAIHDAAHEHCVPCYLGLYPGTTISVRAALALAGLPNFGYPPDVKARVAFNGAEGGHRYTARFVPRPAYREFHLEPAREFGFF